MNWFYESGGQQQGPISDEELDGLVAEGKINAATLVWREGQANWQPLQEARPAGSSSFAAGAPPVPLGAAIPADQIQCANCRRVVPRSEVIQIGARAICANCKPVVLQQIQQGTAPGEFGAPRNGPAWEDRAELGLVKAAWETVRAVLFNPSETFSTMKRTGGFRSTFLYNLLVGGIGFAFGLLFICGMLALLRSISPSSNDVPIEIIYIYLGMGIFAPVLLPLIAFIGGGIFHLSLMLCGGAKQPFETTMRAYSYAYSSSLALMAVPILGMMVAGIWGIVVTIIALAKAHEIPTGKAVLAYFLPVLVCCGLYVVLIIVVMVGAGVAAQSGHVAH